MHISIYVVYINIVKLITQTKEKGEWPLSPCCSNDILLFFFFQDFSKMELARRLKVSKGTCHQVRQPEYNPAWWKEKTDFLMLS